MDGNDVDVDVVDVVMVMMWLMMMKRWPNSNWSLAGRHLRGKKGVFATDE